MKKTNISLMIQVFSWIILFSACNNGNDDSFKVSISLNEKQRITQETKSTMNMKEGILNSNLNMHSICNFDVSKSGKQLVLTYTSLHTGNTGSEAEPESDSIMNATNGLVLNKPFVFKVTHDTSVNLLTGLQSQSTVADSITLRSLDSLAQIHAENFVKMLTSINSDKKLKPGENWSSSVSSNMMGMNMISNLKLTLVSVEDGVAEVSIDGKITGKGSMRLNNDNIEMDLAGNHVGTFHIQTKDNGLKDGSYTMTVRAEADIMGTKIPMDMKVDCQMKVQ